MLLLPEEEKESEACKSEGRASGEAGNTLPQEEGEERGRGANCLEMVSKGISRRRDKVRISVEETARSGAR